MQARVTSGRCTLPEKRRRPCGRLSYYNLVRTSKLLAATLRPNAKIRRASASIAPGTRLPTILAQKSSRGWPVER